MTRPIYLLLAALVVMVASAAHAGPLELTFGGTIQSDVRFRAGEKSVAQGGFWNPLRLPAGVERAQEMITFKLNATMGRFAGVADIDFIWDPYYSSIKSITDLTRYDQISSYFLRAKSAYLEATDLLPGLDLKIGQMIVNWGVGDQFNPTNNLNANDIEDPLYFGRQQGNLMVKADYNFKQVWSLSGVLVPIFKPAILPRSAPLGPAANDRLPFTDENVRYRIHGEQALTSQLFNMAGVADTRFPTVVQSAIPVLPETSAGNMQWAFRLAGKILEQDVALSYYYGRSDMPQPYMNYTVQQRRRICDPTNAGNCVDGVLATSAYLMYPRMQVIGFNMAGQLGWVQKLWRRIKPIGYRFELGVYLPQQMTMALLQEPLNFSMVHQPGGEYDYLGKGVAPYSGSRPEVLSSTPFAKWTLGLDYTFNRFVYMNAMWLHGMVDDFGAGDFFHSGVAVRQGGIRLPAGQTCNATACPALADVIPLPSLTHHYDRYAYEITRPRIGDYLVLGVDIKFLDDRGLFRLFTIWDLSGYTESFWDPATQQRVQRKLGVADGLSAVIYPELSYNFLNGLELGAGAILMLGKDYTKFGDPAAGGHLIFTRARYSY
jgi:hypothetical protein